jgi:hypothetical protein
VGDDPIRREQLRHGCVSATQEKERTVAVIGEIRREIENRLAEAADGRALIQLSREDGNVVLLQGDLTCETDHVEGTDRDGNWVEVPYAAIKAVSLALK